MNYLSCNEIESLKRGIRKEVEQDIKKGHQSRHRNGLWLIDFIDWQRYSGMRISETLNLTPKFINTETWQVTIGSDRFSTKVESKQVLPIGEVEVLKKIAQKLIRQCQSSDELLFQHKDRRRTTKTFKRYVNLSMPAREDVNVHSLRHICCSELLRKEVPIYTVQRWMRHSTIRTTQKYAELFGCGYFKGGWRSI